MGFARDSRFAWAERGESRCALALEDSDATRALYPFAHDECASGARRPVSRTTWQPAALHPQNVAKATARRWPRAFNPLRRRPWPYRRMVSKVLPKDVIARSDACLSSGKDLFLPFSVAAELVRESNDGIPFARLL